jgi:hypothetical protein
MNPRLVIFDMDDVLCHYDSLRAYHGCRARRRAISVGDMGLGFEDESDMDGCLGRNLLAEFASRLG